MSKEKVLILIGFFLVNGLLIGSLFTGRDYIMEILLFTLVANILYVGLLAYIKRQARSD
ncbi:hypothetical protein [Halalkalibacter alkaliphilus]|uniref:Uncharacterized protein n=1 Tax=Halalkalibacter alkaliphilus TaxID=2917993 RepID=A0A9X2CUE4_9BACI|nr:hypothetical protein [Halalkalibacter alkaliphilus]MCL7748428.1 hypothetical protein [Halalkalibacter alkaliphilus]